LRCWCAAVDEKDEPKDYDNVDLTVVNGESSPNSKDSATAYLGEDWLRLGGTRREGARDLPVDVGAGEARAIGGVVGHHLFGV
jgi:hypothetical protein